MSDPYETLPRELITLDVTGFSPYERQVILQAIAKAQASFQAARAENVEAGEWSPTAYDHAMIKLAGSKAEAQIKVIKRAIANGGSITRAEVYELGNYPADRSLKGFTRPANRVTRELRDRGELPEEAEELLQPIYDEDDPSYQQAKGFRVPLELLTFETA